MPIGFEPFVEPQFATAPFLRNLIKAAFVGIGLAAAKALIEAGAFVVVTGRRQTELDRAKQLLGKNATAVLGSADKCD